MKLMAIMIVALSDQHNMGSGPAHTNGEEIGTHADNE